METVNQNTQVIEHIALYESKIKLVKQKIRDELQNRRDLKSKIEGAKKKEILEIQILERLDEYEKLINRHIQLAKNQEDGDSLKMKEIMRKHENILNMQQQVWKKYQKNYEEIPLALKKQKLENKFKKAQIDVQLQFRIDEVKRNLNTMQKIEKKKEQIKMIEMAISYMEHKKKEKNFKDLYREEEHLNKKKNKLKNEIDSYKKKAIEKEKLRNKILKPRKLPEIDLSRFSIKKNRQYDVNSDSISMNSYILEQEYMNVDDLQESLISSYEIEKKRKNTDINKKDESIAEQANFTMSEDNVNLNSTNKSLKKVDFDQVVSKTKQLTFTENHLNQEKSMKLDNQSSKNRDESKTTYTLATNQVQEGTRINTNLKFLNNYQFIDFSLRDAHPIATPAKMNENFLQQVSQEEEFSQEHLKIQRQKKYNQVHKLPLQMQLNQHKQKKIKIDLQEDPNQIQQERGQNLELQKPQLLNQQEHQLQEIKSQREQRHQQSLQKECQPEVLQQQKRDRQFHQQLLQQEKYYNQQCPATFTNDVEIKDLDISLSRSTSQFINKPMIKSNEQVFLNLTELKYKQISNTSTTQSEPTEQHLEQKYEPNSSANNLQSPMSWQINFPCELKTNMNSPTAQGASSSSVMSVDMNFFQDNVSYILGSDVTEPGGMCELKKRMEDVPDLASDDVDFGQLLVNPCSPIGVNESSQKQQHQQQQQQQQTINKIKPEPQNKPSDFIKHDDGNKKFNFGSFVKKQPHNQKFF